MIVAVTGNLGTGKTTVAAMFARHKAKIVDADGITRRLLTKDKKLIKKVAKTFPRAILKQGGIDRKQLSRIVFKNPRALKKLTKIVYPEALKEVKKQISVYRKQTRLIILDIPLLFEAGWDRLADTTIVVCARPQQQYQRIHKRMGLSKAEIRNRLKFQMPLERKCRLADIIIDNSGPLSATRQQVKAIIYRLLQRERQQHRSQNGQDRN